MGHPPDTQTARGNPPQKAESATVRVLLRVAGILCVIIGAIALLVPVLPTTPLLLLAAACFIRSSDRFYGWLIGHRWLGPIIRDYRERRGATLKVKISAVAILWCSIGFSLLFAVDTWPLRAVLIVVAVAVTAHLLMLRSVKPH